MNNKQKMSLLLDDLMKRCSDGDYSGKSHDKAFSEAWKIVEDEKSAHDAEKKQQLLAALPGKLKQRKYHDGTFVYMPDAVRARNQAIDQCAKAITAIYGEDN